MDCVNRVNIPDGEVINLSGTVGTDIVQEIKEFISAGNEIELFSGDEAMDITKPWGMHIGGIRKWMPDFLSSLSADTRLGEKFFGSGLAKSPSYAKLRLSSGRIVYIKVADLTDLFPDEVLGERVAAAYDKAFPNYDKFLFLAGEPLMWIGFRSAEYFLTDALFDGDEYADFRMRLRAVSDDTAAYRVILELFAAQLRKLDAMKEADKEGIKNGSISEEAAVDNQRKRVEKFRDRFLNRITVEEGMFLYLVPGTIHAAGEGLSVQLHLNDEVINKVKAGDKDTIEWLAGMQAGDATALDKVQGENFGKAEAWYIAAVIEGEGFIVAEPQNLSNFTLRIMTPELREIHLEASIEVLKKIGAGLPLGMKLLDALQKRPVSGGKDAGVEEFTFLDDAAESPHFSFKITEAESGAAAQVRTQGRFVRCIVLDGEAGMNGRNYKRGDSFLLPAAGENFRIENTGKGRLRFTQTSVPVVTV